MLRSILIAAGILASTMPLGPSQPVMIRSVTIGEASGPAYYSLIEQGYRFVGGSGESREDSGLLASVELAQDIDLAPAGDTSVPSEQTAELVQ